MHWRDDSNTVSARVALRTRLTVIVSHFILIARIMVLVSKDNVSCFIAFSSPTQLYIALSEPFSPMKSPFISVELSFESNISFHLLQGKSPNGKSGSAYHC
jgi:hypothetical protein